MKNHGRLLLAKAQALAAVADCVRWNAAKLAAMPASRICTAQAPCAARPPSAEACNMASTVRAIAGRTKYRGLNSIMGPSCRPPAKPTNDGSRDRQAPDDFLGFFITY